MTDVSGPSLLSAVLLDDSDVKPEELLLLPVLLLELELLLLELLELLALLLWDVDVESSDRLDGDDSLRSELEEERECELLLLELVLLELELLVLLLLLLVSLLELLLALVADSSLRSGQQWDVYHLPSCQKAQMGVPSAMNSSARFRQYVWR